MKFVMLSMGAGSDSLLVEEENSVGVAVSLVERGRSMMVSTGLCLKRIHAYPLEKAVWLALLLSS